MSQHRTQWLALYSALAALLACGPQAHAVSDAEIAAENARVFAEMKANMPLVTDQDTINYIACVANAVVLELDPEFRDLPWEMAIFAGDTVNAFAMPGGKIGIMEGILKAARTQDQLAAVIGHELAHVTLKHGRKDIGRSKYLGVGIQVAAVLVGGGNQGTTYTAYQALNEGAAYGLILPFSRDQESDADVVGLDFMARAGFDPFQALDLWKNMNEEAGEAPPEFMSTHPSGEKRIDALVSQMSTVLPIYNEATQNGRNPDCIPPPMPEKPPGKPADEPKE
ncbi:MAG: M48 family metallopeptidase [Proteobacteria bacterium]|nr:M48 family metallopeptidase [Pseudomonadota bacterium]MDA1063592.1 M48 family metallopeptidase [Pseudomonadota bacterium]